MLLKHNNRVLPVGSFLNEITPFGLEFKSPMQAMLHFSKCFYICAQTGNQPLEQAFKWT